MSFVSARVAHAHERGYRWFSGGNLSPTGVNACDEYDTRVGTPIKHEISN